MTSAGRARPGLHGFAYVIHPCWVDNEHTSCVMGKFMKGIEAWLK